ncbi:MAG: YdcF family protein [Anaerolineae bacterium]|nr:YdcF family protein [Anaerolineae bacterium]
MFLFLSKFLPQFIYPVGLVLILLVWAWIRQSHDKPVKGLIIIAVVVLWVFGNGWTTALITRSLEWRYLPQEETPRAEVMVLLGGGTEPAISPREHVEVNGAGDRVIHAALLYHEGAAEKIIVSGGGISWLGGREVPAAQEMEDLLVLMGVPREVIIQQGESANTHDDAVYTAAILEEMGIDEIILVTSAMHMQRSVKLFEKQELTVIPSPTDYKLTQVGWNLLFRPSDVQTVLMALIPSVDDMGTTTSAIKEYIGMLVYSLRGWM